MNKKIYHITTAIHDSRTSSRMIKFKVRERRDMGTNPYPNIIYFTDDEELLIAKTIAEIVKKDNLKLIAFNICLDHIHLLLFCDIQKISRIMQKIKAMTSKEVKKFRSTREHTPLHKEHAPLHKKNAPLQNQKPTMATKI